MKADAMVDKAGYELKWRVLHIRAWRGSVVLQQCVDLEALV
jgi:hypothetical protein